MFGGAKKGTVIWKFDDIKEIIDQLLKIGVSKKEIIQELTTYINNKEVKQLPDLKHVIENKNKNKNKNMKTTKLFTSINEFKKYLNNEPINEYYDMYRTAEGTIYFRNKTQAALWEYELLGQLSDGYWENSGGQSWIFWHRLNVAIDPQNPRVEANMSPDKVNYNLSSPDLLEAVGDRMLCIAKMSKITDDKEKLKAAEYLEYVDSIEDLNRLKQKHNYQSEYLKVIDEDTFKKFQEVNYTMGNMKGDLNDMKDIMRSIGWSDSSTRAANKLKKGYEQKDLNRVESIIKKAGGDRDKEISLAQTMANKIKDGRKLVQRGNAAEENNYHNIAKVFFDKAEELGFK